MSLDLDKLENVRERGGKIIAACPACREAGADQSGEHLVIFGSGVGRFGCIANSGAAGYAHRRRIAELAGGGATVAAKPYSMTRAPVRTAPLLPPLRTPTQDDLAQIAKVRGWPTEKGMEALVKRGYLFVADIFDHGKFWPAWVVTDPTRANAQARRMDGAAWSGIDAKAKSLPGTTAARVIGAACIGTRPQIWLTEGTPDLCAAPIVARLAGLDLDQIAFACVTGAGNSIHENDMPHFVGKSVVIAMHHDAANGKGAEAAKLWARQLYLAGAAQVRGFDFAGTGGKDLADYLCRLAKPQIPAPAVSNPTASENPVNVKESPPADPSKPSKPPATYHPPACEEDLHTIWFSSDGAVGEVVRAPNHRPTRRAPWRN
jgi:hypothetical protein